MAITAQLAATYLTLEAPDEALPEDFGRRAPGAGVAVAGMAWLTLGLAKEGAPALFAALTFAEAAAPPQILGPMLAALAGGSVLLLPAFVWLYRVCSRSG